MAAAFMHCAAICIAGTGDCLQCLLTAGATNIRWLLNGDPLAGSAVRFDPKTGLITVHGDFVPCDQAVMPRPKLGADVRAPHGPTTLSLKSPAQSRQPPSQQAH